MLLYKLPHFTELFQKTQMPPCTMRYRVSFTLTWEEAGEGLVSLAGESRGLVRCWWASVAAQALLGSPLPVTVVGGKCLEANSLGNLIQCMTEKCSHAICAFLLHLLFLPSLLMLAEESVLTFMQRTRGLCLGEFQTPLHKFLLVWLVIKAHCLQAWSAVSKVVLPMLQPNCFKGVAAL